MNIVQELIPLGHPNRPGFKMVDVLVFVVHWTNNDRPGMDDWRTGEYFARPYVQKPELAVNGWDKQWFEADGVTPFRFGSAHFGCDDNSITQYMLEDDEAWHCGDISADQNGHPDWEYIPKNNGFGGYRPIVGHLLGGNPNKHAIGVEITNNTDSIWTKAVDNAIDLIRDYAARRNRMILPFNCLTPQQQFKMADGELLVDRHYDITGKYCPRPMVENYAQWAAFVERLAS